jgi:hypothetical protein
MLKCTIKRSKPNGSNQYTGDNTKARPAPPEIPYEKRESGKGKTERGKQKQKKREKSHMSLITQL